MIRYYSIHMTGKTKSVILIITIGKDVGQQEALHTTSGSKCKYRHSA